MSFNVTFNNIKYNFNISQSLWSSNTSPAMMQTSDYKIIKDDLIENKLNLIELLEEIKNFYREIGTTSQEIYINEWILLSIENIIKISENYKKDNIHTIDFAYKYLGLGHVKVAFYDKKFNRILYRHDGGSNGYDREDNFEKLKIYNSNTNDNIYYGLTFDTFLKEITEKKPETAMGF